MFAKRIVGACAIAAALGLGCAEQQEALIIVGIGAWTMEGQCIVDAETQEFLQFGTLDLYCLSAGAPCQVSTSYYLPVVLESQLFGQSADMSNTATDPSEVQLTDVEVSYRIPQVHDDVLAGNNLSTFSPSLATNSIPGGARAGIIVEVINQAQAQALYDYVNAAEPNFTEVTLEVSLFFTAERSGNGRGGPGEIESRHYSFPIKLCVGCLLSCTGCVDGCPESDPATVEWTGGICGNAQDGYLTPAACAM